MITQCGFVFYTIALTSAKCYVKKSTTQFCAVEASCSPNSYNPKVVLSCSKDRSPDLVMDMAYIKSKVNSTIGYVECKEI